MKKLFCNIFLIFMITGVLFEAQASDNFIGIPVISEVPSSKKLKLTTTGNKSSEVSCRIQLENGPVMHHQKIDPKIVHTTLFDLSNLEQGSYVIELEDEKSFQEFHVDINEEKLEINQEYKIVYKPYTSYNKGFLNLNLLSRGMETKVKITDNFSEIYSEIIAGAPTISKRYDISKLPKGKYTVEISIGGKYFYENIYK